LLPSTLTLGAGFAVLEAFTTLDSGYPVANGATILGEFGLGIGAIFSGPRVELVDDTYGRPPGGDTDR
jgi:hypothetical protein